MSSRTLKALAVGTVGLFAGIGLLAAFGIDLRDEGRWWISTSRGEPADLGVYLQEWPAGRHAAEARRGLSDDLWNAVSQKRTIRGFNEYLQRFPAESHASSARVEIDALLASDAEWLKAESGGTEQSLTFFVREFPDHRRAEQAREALHDVVTGRSIGEAVASKRVTISGLDQKVSVNLDPERADTPKLLFSVKLELTPKVPHSLKVRIPPGTVFRSPFHRFTYAVRSGQSVILRKIPMTIELEVVQVVTERGLSAGTAIQFGFDDTMYPSTSVLERALEGAREVRALGHAIIWVALDNLTFRQLQENMFTFPGSETLRPLVTANDTARALQLLDDAGLNVQSRSIWRDRDQLASAVDEPSLKSWFQLREKQDSQR